MGLFFHCGSGRKDQEGIGHMKSIKSKILVNMLPVVLIGSILIGAVSAVLNYKGTYAVLESTIVPAADIDRKSVG